MEKNSSLAWAIAKVIRKNVKERADGKVNAGLSGLSETCISFIEHAHTKLFPSMPSSKLRLSFLLMHRRPCGALKENEKQSAASEKQTGRPEEKHQIAATLMHDILFLSHPLNLNKGKPLLCNVKLGETEGNRFLIFKRGIQFTCRHG